MNAKDAVVKRFWELCEKDNIKKNELARRAVFLLLQYIVYLMINVEMYLF